MFHRFDLGAVGASFIGSRERKRVTPPQDFDEDEEIVSHEDIVNTSPCRKVREHQALQRTPSSEEAVRNAVISHPLMPSSSSSSQANNRFSGIWEIPNAASPLRTTGLNNNNNKISSSSSRAAPGSDIVDDIVLQNPIATVGSSSKKKGSRPVYVLSPIKHLKGDAEVSEILGSQQQQQQQQQKQSPMTLLSSIRCFNNNNNNTNPVQTTTATTLFSSSQLLPNRPISQSQPCNESSEDICDGNDNDWDAIPSAVSQPIHSTPLTQHQSSWKQLISPTPLLNNLSINSNNSNNTAAAASSSSPFTSGKSKRSRTANMVAPLPESGTAKISLQATLRGALAVEAIDDNYVQPTVLFPGDHAEFDDVLSVHNNDNANVNNDNNNNNNNNNNDVVMMDTDKPESWLQKVDVEQAAAQFSQTPEKNVRKSHKGLLGQLHRVLDAQKAQAVKTEIEYRSQAESAVAPLVVCVVEEGDPTMPVLLCLCRLASNNNNNNNVTVDVVFPMDLISSLSLHVGALILIPHPWMQLDLPPPHRPVIFCPKSAKSITMEKLGQMRCQTSLMRSVDYNNDNKDDDQDNVMEDRQDPDMNTMMTMTIDGEQVVTPISELTPYSSSFVISVRFVSIHSQNANCMVIVVSERQGSTAKIEVPFSLLSSQWENFMQNNGCEYVISELNMKQCRHACRGQWSQSKSCNDNCVVVLKATEDSSVHSSIARAFTQQQQQPKIIDGHPNLVQKRVSLSGNVIFCSSSSLSSSLDAVVVISTGDRDNLAIWMKARAVSVGDVIHVDEAVVPEHGVGGGVCLVVDDRTRIRVLSSSPPAAGLLFEEYLGFLNNGYIHVRGMIVQASYSFINNQQSCCILCVDNGVVQPNVAVPFELLAALKKNEDDNDGEVAMMDAVERAVGQEILLTAVHTISNDPSFDWQATSLQFLTKDHISTAVNALLLRNK